MSVGEEAKSGIGKYLVIYVCILGLAGLQFIIAYQQIDPSQMFVRMLLVALVEGALAVMYFMHLGEERRSLQIFVVLITVFVLLAMQYGWTDSFRISAGVPWAK
jgi:caa(3)-type oxidase subunit IV